jgi:magnesium-transporting ATPase (P-type)
VHQFKKKKWQNIKAGELVKILKDEEFPSDIVLLKSDKESGIVFVDTMNLDGEVCKIIHCINAFFLIRLI